MGVPTARARPRRIWLFHKWYGMSLNLTQIEVGLGRDKSAIPGTQRSMCIFLLPIDTGLEEMILSKSALHPKRKRKSPFSVRDTRHGVVRFQAFLIELSNPLQIGSFVEEATHGSIGQGYGVGAGCF